MPALFMVISPTQPCDGQQVGKTVLMTKYSQPPLFLGRRVPPHSLTPTGLGSLKQSLTPATSPANRTPSNWSLSLRARTTAPQTSLPEPQTHLKGALTGWPEGLA